MNKEFLNKKFKKAIELAKKGSNIFDMSNEDFKVEDINKKLWEELFSIRDIKMVNFSYNKLIDYLPINILKLNNMIAILVTNCPNIYSKNTKEEYKEMMFKIGKPFPLEMYDDGFAIIFERAKKDF